MKSLSYLAMLLALSLSITACSDEEAGSPNNEALVGTWRLESIDYSGTSSTTVQGTTFTSVFVGEGYDLDVTVTFSEDPDTYTTDGDYSIRLTTTTQGQTVEQDFTFEGFLDDGTWERDGENVIITNGDGDVFETIIVLTDGGNTMMMDVEETTIIASQTGDIISTVVQSTVFTRE
jgi:hypothetical protein